MGKPLGTETYRIIITGGVIIDRRRVEADDNCAIARPTSRSSGDRGIRMINARLTLPLKLHLRSNGFFQSFPLASP